MVYIRNGILCGNINVFMVWLALADGLPYIMCILVVLVAVYTFFTNKTVAGRHVYALAVMQRLLSFQVSKQSVILGICKYGLLSAIAGIVFLDV